MHILSSRKLHEGGIFLNKHTEATERYCHVIGRNTPIIKTYADGKTVYECMSKHLCEKSGGCTNAKFSSCGKNLTHCEN